jgi:endonuclease/exonuclease/phosphatase family metal-dependent hydrolase
MGTALLGNAEQIRVATWNLTWFPSGSPDPATPQQEEANIQAVASTLNGLQPDVIVLQEVRDSRACEQLALRLGPGSYQVNVCSAFRDGGGPAATRRQLAILSRFPAMAGWAEEWQAEGAVLPPGGWAFAALHWGATALGVFAVHLKSNVGLGERDTQLNILKRELCAEQLLRTVDGLSGRLTNRLDALVVAGNFNTDLDQARFVSERTLRALLEADFSHGFDGVPLAERVTIPGQGRYADATFDYIFARGGSFVARPEIVRTEWSDHFVVAADLAVTPPPPPPLPALAPTVEAPPSVSPAVVSTLAPVGAQPHVNWPLWAFLFVLLGLHLAIWQAVRARKAVAVGSRKTRETSATEDCGLSEAGDRIIVPLRTAEKLQPALGATETGPRGVHPEPPPATAVVRSHLLPQLARLMVNRLVQGLLFQRARMMQAQETAAEHIHELEERLGRIQSQLQQRLSTYEQRIAELEKELAAKEQENRALLQAQQRVLRDAPAADKEKEPAVV